MPSGLRILMLGGCPVAHWTSGYLPESNGPPHLVRLYRYAVAP